MNREAGTQRISRRRVKVLDSGVRSNARTTEEAELVARIAGGDLGEPLAELVARYKGPLFGYGFKILGDTWLAEELVHECFIRLWRTAGRFDASRSSVSTYLYMVARTIAVDLHRRSVSQIGREVRGHLDGEDTELDDALQVPDDTSQLVERLSMREALDELTPAHREVITLAHFDSLTQVEIAERLGIPLGTVKTRTFHGLKALRAILDNRGNDE